MTSWCGNYVKATPVLLLQDSKEIQAAPEISISQNELQTIDGPPENWKIDHVQTDENISQPSKY